MGSQDPLETPAQATTQSMGSPQAQALMTVLKAFAQAKGAGGGGGGGGGVPASQGPGTVAGLPGTGQFPLPTPTQPRQPGGTPPSNELMSKLSPNAAGVYQGIQGISNLLQNYEQKKDMQQHTQAENIAKNLMTAMDATNSPDEKTRMNGMAQVYEILNDKQQKKILDKVYKGWLEQAQQQQGETDPEQAGFEKGIKDYIATGKMPQGGPPQMPRQMGGVNLPQAGPAEQMKNLIQQQQLAYAKAHPETAGMTPDQWKFETERVKYETEVKRGLAEAQVAQANATKAATELQVKEQELKLEEQRTATEKAKSGFDVEKHQLELDELRQKSMAASFEADAARWRAEYARIHPPGSPATKTPTTADLRKPDAADAIVRKLEGMVKNGQGFSPQDVQQLNMQLRSMGAADAANKLPSWFGARWAQGPDGVADLLGTMKDFRDQVTQPIRDKWPDWKFGWDKGGAAKGEADPKGSAEAPAGDGWSQIQGGPWVPPQSEWPQGAQNITPSKDGKSWYFTSEKGDMLGVVPTRPQ